MAESEVRQAASGAPAGLAGVLLDNLISAAHVAGAIFGFAALAVLAVRAWLRIETRWDAFYYHIPLAARRGGLGVPYDMPPLVKDLYDGFPPLPEFLQGVLWRATGSLNATGVINILALAVFLGYCHYKLKAPFSVVAVLSLTAPLVIIHAATSYIDLFGNALLAMGVTSLAAMMLFDRWADRSLLCWGLAGFAGAAWSKMILLPVAFPGCLCFLGFYASHFRNRAFRRSLLLAAAVAAFIWVPLVKNQILYHNPIWPTRMPVWSDRFPFTFDPRPIHAGQTPPPLLHLSQFNLFVHSVLEIGHPTEYASRERWTLDQGNAWIAFRSGGFWSVGVITAALAAVLLGFLCHARKGWALLGFLAAMWCCVAFLPQSHELRYHLFLPLTMAAIIAMLLARVRRDYPAVTLVLLAVFLGEFIWMVKVNRAYYRVERADYRTAAEFWGVTPWWPMLQRGQTYCAVGFAPAGMFLTGPTMKEFHIIDRPDRTECPPHVQLIIAAGAGAIR
jgi:hypothetical protein